MSIYYSSAFLLFHGGSTSVSWGGMWTAHVTIFNSPTNWADTFRLWGLTSPVRAVFSCVQTMVWLPKFWITDPHRRTPKKNTSHRNEVRLQDTMHLTQRPCYQRGSPCQDPEGNQTTWGPPDHCKETQTAVVWTCLPFIRSGQNHFAWHSERGKKTRQTEEHVGRQHLWMDRPGVCQVPEGSGELRKNEETGCQIICGAQTTLAVKGLMMMMMNICTDINASDCTHRGWMNTTTASALKTDCRRKIPCLNRQLNLEQQHATLDAQPAELHPCPDRSLVHALKITNTRYEAII